MEYENLVYNHSLDSKTVNEDVFDRTVNEYYIEMGSLETGCLFCVIARAGMCQGTFILKVPLKVKLYAK